MILNHLSKKQMDYIKYNILKRRNDMELLKKLWNDEEGQGLIEYALIIAIISLVIIIAGRPVATAIQGIFTRIQAGLS